MTSLVDNAIGRLIEDLMLQGGVDTDRILWRSFDGVGLEARNGIYFLERGFGVRAGLGVMDRGATAISRLEPGTIDWDAIFSSGIKWFHTGGIMAALSSNTTAVVREAMLAARRHGTVVSFDCNYRPSLWRTRGGRAGSVEVNRLLMPMVDVLFGHEGDIAQSVEADAGASVWYSVDAFHAMAVRVTDEFPNIKVLASTVRRIYTAGQNDWSAFAFADGEIFEGLRFERLDILDRVGGGDSFAAGLIFALLKGLGLEYAVNCGVAHGALTMTTAGDASMVTLDEVKHLMAGGRAGTQR